MNLISIPVFKDNYIWLLVTPQKRSIIVDPGDSGPVLQMLTQLGLIPSAILLTHHHKDHTAGVSGIRERYPDLAVYGPQETLSCGTNILVSGGETITIDQQKYTVIAVPGHTLGHLAFYNAPYLFCGDTLFSAGCGRVFEGTMEQMFQSLQTLSQLPDDTLVCCAHEFTANNLRFARTVLVKEQEIEIQQQHVKALREEGKPSLPSALGLERKINPFLRCDDLDLQNEMGFSSPTQNLVHVFAELRHRKDHF